MAEIKFAAGGEFGVGHDSEPDPADSSRLAMWIYYWTSCDMAALSSGIPCTGHRTVARASKRATA